MKKFLFLLIVFFFNNSLFAEPISIETAKKVAKNWYFERGKIDRKGFSIEDHFVESDATKGALFYIFNFNPTGFVMVSADNIVVPVLGYSFIRHYTTENHPPAFDSMLVNWKEQIIYAKKNKLKSLKRNMDEWDRLNVMPTQFIKNEKIMAVEPLLNTTRGQGKYYNQLCPADAAGSDGHCVTGCVATAMAQVMKSHDFPTTGTNNHGYTHPTYGYQYANFGATTYNWAGMPNSLSSYNTAVATLMYHCGVSVEMDYGPGGSGAGYAHNAFVNYFRYGSELIFKSSYSSFVWVDLMMNELNNNRPIPYYGFPQSGWGHAFVMDGYQGTDHFHFNWGWNGNYDDYFYLNDLTPGISDYTNNQTAIIKVMPSPPKPKIVSVTYNNSIEAGQYSEIYVKVRNDGSQSNDGDISISFPSFTNSTDVQYVEKVSSSSDAPGYQEYPKGTSIWHKDLYQFSANYLLVGWGDNSWNSSEQNELKIRVYPQTTGTFTFYVRSAMGKNNAYYNSPSSSSYKDQQGWTVSRYTISVGEEEPDYYDAVDVDHIVIEDDDGDEDGIPEAGEPLELKVYLENDISENIWGVHGKLSSTNPDVIIDDDYGDWGGLTPGEVDYGQFEFHTLSSGNIDFNLTVTFSTSSGSYYDTETIPITIYPQGSGPSFTVQSVAFYDTSADPRDYNNNNGILESGEDDVDFKVRLKNVGNGPATDVEAYIPSFVSNGITVVIDDEEDYPDISAGSSRNPDHHFTAGDRIPLNLAGKCTLDMWVYYGGAPDSQKVRFYWDIGAVPYLRANPTEYDFGVVSPGTSVRKNIQVRNIGSANLIIDSINTDYADTWVEGISLPWTIAPQDTDSVTIVIQTGMNASITRNITLFSNSHDTSSTRSHIIIRGTVTIPPEAKYKLLWSTPENEPRRACCVGSGDTDNDGKPEIIIGTYASTYLTGDSLTQIHIYEKVSDDNYQKVWVSPVNAINGGLMCGEGMIVEDIDGDGTEEIIVAVNKYSGFGTEKVYIYKSNSDNNWYLWYSGLNSGLAEKDDFACVCVGDADGDGKNEIIYGIGNGSTGYGGRIYVYEYDGGTSFSKIWTSSILIDEGGVCDIAVGDADSDGKNDIVASAAGNDSTRLYVFETTGNNSFSQVFSVGVDDGWSHYIDNSCDITICDIDGDGAKEIAVGSEEDDKVSIFENTGNNAYTKIWDSPNFGREPTDIVAGDADLDGKKELIVCIHSHIPKLRIYETFANNSYVQIWSDTIHIDDPSGICLTNTNSTPELEIVVVDEDDEKFWVFGIFKQPNLEIASSNIQFSNTTPKEGAVDTISVLVRNLGNAKASGIKVQFFDGDPVSGGVQIGSDIQIDSLDINESSQIETEWIPTLPDTHSIYVVIDPDSLITESNENDNIAFAKIYVYDDDEELPVISNITVWPDTSFQGPFPVYSTIIDNEGISKAELWYKTSVDTNWAFIEMDTTGVADEYLAEIPLQPISTEVWYYIYSEDIAIPANQAKDPADAPNTSYSFVAGYIGTEEAPRIPKIFFVAQNQPNPFTGATEIIYGLPKDSHVEITVYNLLGQKVASLVQGNKKAGYYTINWDRKSNVGKRLATGIYFYRMEAGKFKATRKLTILK